MKENSIEKDKKILNNIKAYMQENIDKGYHKFIYNDLGYDEKCVDVINAIEHILSDYKRVLKENEILKKEKEQAWEEWNNLEQGSYQTEQNLKKQLEKLRIENDKLRVIRHETKYGMETTYLIPKERLIEINTNKYIVEIENGKFVDLKEVYQENEELKRKNKTLEELLQGNLYELYKYYKELAGTYQGNCISKEKIKNKIEYLKDYIEENSDEQGYWGNINSDIIYGKIEILEESLEESEE